MEEEEFTTEEFGVPREHGGLQEKNEEVKKKKVKTLKSYFLPFSLFFCITPW